MDIGISNDGARLGFSIIDAARALSISPRYLESLIAAGAVRSTRIGRRHIIARVELERLAIEGADAKRPIVQTPQAAATVGGAA